MFKFGKTRVRTVARDAAPTTLDSGALYGPTPADPATRSPNGWLDSSQDLRQGLEVVELEAAEWPFETEPARR
ncbi:hypothetical protein [Schlegelella aquatica]|uniref:hypothetical protein n=1 Tax=Caldimonas aquatica TaxID=376175 RepID=UPI0037512496